RSTTPTPRSRACRTPRSWCAACTAPGAATWPRCGCSSERRPPSRRMPSSLRARSRFGPVFFRYRQAGRHGGSAAAGRRPRTHQEQDEDEPMIQLSSRVRHLAMVLGAAIALAACGDRSPPPPAQEAAAPAEAASRPMLVPLPARLEQREGSFRFDAGVALGAAGHVAGMVAAPHGFTPARAGEGGQAAIVFAIDPAASPDAPEGYELEVTREGAQVRASDERGLFYGAVTLWQLLSSAQGEA